MPPLTVKKSKPKALQFVLTPAERKVQKLEERIRRLESKLAKADRREATSAGRLVDLAAENRRVREELEDVLEEAEELKAEVQSLKKERDQVHAWWTNEVAFSQSLLDDTAQTFSDFATIGTTTTEEAR